MKYFDYKGVKTPLEFSFNSIMLIEDLDLIGVAEELKSKPLKIMSITVDLLWAVLNKDIYKFDKRQVASMLEEWTKIEGNNMMTLFDDLQTALTESDFFRQIFNSQEANK